MRGSLTTTVCTAAFVALISWVFATPTAVAAAATSYAVQVGAFRVRTNAAALLEDLAPRYSDARIVTAELGGRVVYRVVVGNFPVLSAARARERMLRADGLSTYVHRLDTVEPPLTGSALVAEPGWGATGSDALNVGSTAAAAAGASPRRPLLEQRGPALGPGAVARPLGAIRTEEIDAEMPPDDSPGHFRLGVADVSVAMTEEWGGARMARAWRPALSESPVLEGPARDSGNEFEKQFGKGFGKELGLKVEADALDGLIRADAVYDQQSAEDQAVDLRLRATALDGRLRARASYDATAGHGRLKSLGEKKDANKRLPRRSLDVAYDLASLKTSLLGQHTAITATARHVQPFEDERMSSELQLRGSLGQLGFKARHQWHAERTDSEAGTVEPANRTIALDLSFPLAPVLGRIAGDRAAALYPYLYYKRRWVRSDAPWAGGELGRASGDSLGLQLGGGRWSLSYWLSLSEDRGVTSFWEPYTTYRTMGHDVFVGLQLLPSTYVSGSLSASSVEKDGIKSWSGMAPGFGLHWAPIKDGSLYVGWYGSVANDSEWSTHENYSGLNAKLSWPLHFRSADRGIDGRFVLSNDLYMSGYRAPVWGIDSREEAWSVGARVEFALP
jgi:hypothetical protein